MPKESMKKLHTVSDKITDYLYPLVLFLFPFANLGYGIDVTDTTYNLARATMYRDIAGSTWSMAHELSDLLTLLFMRLPFGDTMIGVTAYCTAIVSASALLGYFFLKKHTGKIAAFFGGLLAVGYSWAPKTGVYNYLTYFVMTLAVIFIVKAFLTAKEKYLIFAGICLGLNVFVRFPNIAEAAFILLVWYGCYVKKCKPVRYTLKCLMGYAIGFGALFLLNSVLYGIQSFPDMVAGLFSSSGEAKDYESSSMLLGILKGYGNVTLWVLFMLFIMACGLVLFRLFKGRFVRAKAAVYIAVLLLMLRFFWGRGMFGLDFTQYFSMIAYATIFLLLGIFVTLFVMLSKKAEEKDKLLSAAAFFIILLSPIGSNNNVYPSINNLYLAGAIVLYDSFRVVPKLLMASQNSLKNSDKRFMKEFSGLSGFPLKAMLVCTVTVCLVQSVLFGMTFVFRDGQNAPMDTCMSVGRMKGMYTEKEKAEALTGLYEYFESVKPSDAENTYRGAAGPFLSDKKAIFYGEVPGFGYLLNLRCALSHTWPDLDTYETSVLFKELNAISEPVYVIMPLDVAKRLLDDENAQALAESGTANKKDEILASFLAKNSAEEVYANEKYTVFLTGGAK